MTTLIIPAARLDLVLQTPEEVLAWIETMPPVDRAEVSPDWIARVRSTPAGNPWAFSYTLVERSSGTTVGSCAFKGPPTAGVVEIAYGVDPAHQRQGFATEAACALTNFAFASGQVQQVIAHCRPDNVASSRVLAKSGFVYKGEVVDPEDGLVSRWERGKNPVE